MICGKTPSKLYVMQIPRKEFLFVEKMYPFQKYFLDHQEDLYEILVEGQLHRELSLPSLQGRCMAEFDHYFFDIGEERMQI
jgi:hypothetical protein